jgi:hypothetical protein
LTVLDWPAVGSAAPWTSPIETLRGFEVDAAVSGKTIVRYP